MSQCGDGKYINNTVCVECSLNCKECDSQTCYMCYDNFFLDHQGNCVSECPDMYFENINNCSRCPDNCLLCNSAT